MFDSSGRPLGITTFTIDGQNLNVAILAEDWRYALCMAGLDFIGQPLEGELSLIAPDGGIAAKSRE